MPDETVESETLLTTCRHFAKDRMTAEEFSKFRVKGLTDSYADRIVHLLKTSRRFPKVLLVTQGGCGSSSVLRQVSTDRELKKRKHILLFSLADEINLMDAEAVDILFAIYSRMLRSMPEADFIPPFSDFREMADPLLTESGILEKDTELLQTVSFRFRTDHVFRKKLRAKLKSGEDGLRRSLEKVCRQFSRTTYDCFRLSENTFARLREEEVSDNILSKLEEMKDREYKSEIRFVKSLEKRIGEVQLLHYKDRILKHAWTEEPTDLLILVDDADKLAQRAAEKIFLEEFSLLSEPDAGIVYTLPLYISYAPLFSHMKKDFVLEVIRPLRISDAAGNPDISAVALLKQMVLKQMPDFFSEEVLTYLISQSGGVLSDLLALIRISCRIAIAENVSLIDRKTAGFAVKDMADNCMRFFDFEEYGDTVNRIIRSKNSRGVGSKTLGHLLKYGFVLEYGSPDDNMQSDAHPLLKEALNRIT